MTLKQCLTAQDMSAADARHQFRDAIRELDDLASRKRSPFGGREQGAIYDLRMFADELAGAALEPIAEKEQWSKTFLAAYNRLGAPGDFGYGTPEGDALRWLYESWNLWCEAVKNDTANAQQAEGRLHRETVNATEEGGEG